MQNYLFSDKQKSQALFWLVLFHIAVIASSNYLVQFPFTITLPNGFEVHSTWGALTFPFIFLSTDLTVRIFGQSLARRIIFFVMLPAQQRIAHLLAAIGWDSPPPDDRFEFDMTTPRLFKISALTHEGTQELVQQINQYISEKKRLMAEEAAAQAQQQPEMDLPETNRDVFQAED